MKRTTVKKDKHLLRFTRWFKKNKYRVIALIAAGTISSVAVKLIIDILKKQKIEKIHKERLEEICKTTENETITTTFKELNFIPLQSQAIKSDPKKNKTPAEIEQALDNLENQESPTKSPRTRIENLRYERPVITVDTSKYPNKLSPFQSPIMTMSPVPLKSSPKPQRTFPEPSKSSSRSASVYTELSSQKSTLSAGSVSANSPRSGSSSYSLGQDILEAIKEYTSPKFSGLDPERIKLLEKEIQKAVANPPIMPKSPVDLSREKIIKDDLKQQIDDKSYIPPKSPESTKKDKSAELTTEERKAKEIYDINKVLPMQYYSPAFKLEIKPIPDIGNTKNRNLYKSLETLVKSSKPEVAIPRKKQQAKGYAEAQKAVENAKPDFEKTKYKPYGFAEEFDVYERLLKKDKKSPKSPSGSRRDSKKK